MEIFFLQTKLAFYFVFRVNYRPYLEIINKFNMFAIVETGGKQYLVEEGQKLKVETLKGEEGENITLDKVLLTTDGKEDGTKMGTPYLEGASVEAKVLSHGRGKKIRVFKKESKKRYERTQGHRQNYTELEITKIG